MPGAVRSRRSVRAKSGSLAIRAGDLGGDGFGLLRKTPPGGGEVTAEESVRRGRQSLTLRFLHIFQRLQPPREVGEAHPDRVRRRIRAKVEASAHLGQNRCVDLIGLRQAPCRASEIARLPRVHAPPRRARRVERLHERALVSARGFKDGERACSGGIHREPRQRLWLGADPALRAGAENMNVDPVLCGIDADYFLCHCHGACPYLRDQLSRSCPRQLFRCIDQRRASPKLRSGLATKGGTGSRPLTGFMTDLKEIRVGLQTHRIRSIDRAYMVGLKTHPTDQSSPTQPIPHADQNGNKLRHAHQRIIYFNDLSLLAHAQAFANHPSAQP